MTVQYEGSLTLGEAIPMAVQAQLALNQTANAIIPDVQARIDGLLSVTAMPPPNLADLIVGAQASLAALQAMVAVPVPDAAAVADMLVEMQAQLAELSAGLSFATSFGELLHVPGVHYYLYAGRCDALGVEMHKELYKGLPGTVDPRERIAGAVMLASDETTIAAMKKVLKKKDPT